MPAEGAIAVARRLWLTRKALGVQQSAFCRLTGVSTTAWNNYERGIRRISIDEALKVCAHTGMTLDWIYGGIRQGLPLSLAEGIAGLERSGAEKE